MRSTRGALFDLDGVLIDSESTYSIFWGDAGRRYHPEIADFAVRIKGSTLPRILADYFPDPAVAATVTGELDAFEAQMQLPLFPGVMDFLGDLRRHGIPAAIATSSGPEKMQRLFRENPAFAACFDALITSADVARSKPDPQCYLLAAERLGVDIARCYVFEDSLNGLAAGMASGATVVGLSTTLPAAALAGRAHLLAPSLASLSVARLLAIR